MDKTVLPDVRHSWVIRTIPEHPLPILNPLAPSWVSLCLSNALRTSDPLAFHWHIPDPMLLQPSLFLASSQFLTWHYSSLFLHQVYSWCFISPATAVRQSPIAYLSCSICPSLSFLALYISVSLLSAVCSSVSSFTTLCSFFYVSSSVPRLCLPLFHLSLFYPSINPTLIILYFPYDPFLIVQINLILTTVMDQLVLPRPYRGSYRGHMRRGWLTPKLEVRLRVWKVPMGCPLWERAWQFYRGGRVLARGTGFCT